MIKIKEIKFSDQALSEIEQILTRYPSDRKKSALLPILHLAQADLGGYLTVPIMDYVAGILDIKPIEVYEVATFYSMFHTKKVGKYVLEVCRTAPCSLVGADRIIAYIKQKLNIEENETSKDGLFTLKTVECLAACGMGPVLQIGPKYTYYENLTEEKIDSLIDDLRLKAQQ